MGRRSVVSSSLSGSILGLLEGALAAHGLRLRALAARAEAGGDAELVHDVRVSLRRLEALARLYRGVPGKGDGEAVRASARILRRRLSLLRSEEVGRALLAARTEAADGGIEALVFPGNLPAVRVGASDLARVERALTGWSRRLASAFDGPFAPRVDGEALLRRMTRRRLRRRFAELSSLLPAGRKTLHAARIAAKRVRYALEAVEPLDPGVRPLLRLLRSFQEAAGDAHDLVELAARVRTAAATASAPGPLVEPLVRALDAEAGRVLSTARRRGAALAGPVRKVRCALGAPKTR
jgi:CHAD domain-containing protein